jgi:hypothetical protein
MGYTFSSQILTQGTVGGVGSHCELGGGKGAGLVRWEGLAIIVSWEGGMGWDESISAPILPQCARKGWQLSQD